MEQLIIKAKQILESSPYLVVASVDKNGMSNNSPMFSVYDEKYTFFWNSQINSKHSENIRVNPDVFCVVFDPSIKDGGTYMPGKAYEINDHEELKKIFKIYYAKRGKAPDSVEIYLNENQGRFYKFVPEKFYMNTYERINGLPVDGKIEIKL
jgi:general stress protein 26